jgi:cobalt-zinc-cadmium efflux system outer membrane protein
VVSSMSHRTILFAILAAGVTTAGFALPAADGSRLTRREAVGVALSRNYAIAAEREQVEEARARVAEAVALPDPSFAATLEQETGLLHPRSATSQDIGLGLTLPFPERIRLKGRVATADLRAAELALELLRQQIANQTAMAYDAVLAALRHHEDLEQARDLANDFLKKTDARFQAGSAPHFDVVKAKVDVAQAETNLLANERAITVARTSLNRLLGRPPGAPIELADALEVPAPLPPIEGLEALAVSARPDLQSVAAQREGARSALSLAKIFWFPDINLVVSRNFTAGDPAAYSSSVGFALPLFFWQHEKGEVAEARHHQEELAANYAEQLSLVTLDVHTTYATASTAIRQAAFIRDELLPQAREAFRIASTSYSLGGLSALDLLDAKRAMLDAENQYTDALAAANDARADLERAVGAALPAIPGEHP